MMIENEQNNNDVTEFLEIPVDGSPESMRQKLIEKGFKFIPDDDHTIAGLLIEIFNNEQVGIGIQKNKGKVWRIHIQNKYDYSKNQVIKKFNSILAQFDAKANYTRNKYSGDTYYIPDDVNDEDFDRNVEKQKYQATYYQGNSKMKQVWFMIKKQLNSDKYYIWIHYENSYNAPKDGEDL